jgi:hypothetical protein
VAIRRRSAAPTASPGLVIRSDPFDERPSATIRPVTSELRATPLFRIEEGQLSSPE